MKPYNILESPNPLLALAATAGSAVSSQGSNLSGEKLFFHHVEHLRPTMAPVKELKGPIGKHKQRVLRNGCRGESLRISSPGLILEFSLQGQIMSLDRPNAIIGVEQNKFLMSSSRYISWGFADCSVRVCHVDTDRPLFIWEQSQQELWMGNVGEIVTCTAASEKLAITGSTNTV